METHAKGEAKINRKLGAIASYLHNTYVMRRSIRRKGAQTILVFLGLILLPPFSVAASNFGTGTFGTCQFGTCSISLTSNGTVNLNITPTPSGTCTISSDTVSVLTDNSNGYNLTLNNSSTNTSLVSGANSISAGSGTLASPVALAVNRWGYRVDGLGGFGSGPTTPVTNVSPGSTTFAGMAASNGTPDTLANTSSAADPAVNTTVWYGVCADTTIINGAYTTQAIYTAVTN